MVTHAGESKEDNDRMRSLLPDDLDRRHLLISHVIEWYHPPEVLREILCAVRDFKDFTPEHAPSGLHEAGLGMVDGCEFFWKMGYLEYEEGDDEYIPGEDNNCRIISITKPWESDIESRHDDGDPCSEGDPTLKTELKERVEDRYGVWDKSRGAPKGAFLFGAGVDKDVLRNQILETNNRLRRQLPSLPDPHRLVLSQSLGSLSDKEIAELLRLVRESEVPVDDNNPYGEGDFGKINFKGETYYWKFDYFDARFMFHRVNGNRVLTIMHASESEKST